jgi:hypothetical protein
VALNWSSVKPENVTEACELILRGERRPKVVAKGIFVIFKEQRLPAKHVARLAYCLANRLPLDSKLKFSSGDGIINLLQRRGHVVTRIPT